MNVSRLKRYLPRLPSGIYGRAALIMLMPIVLLQIVVSFAFIRRDLEDITKQMAYTMIREFTLISDEVRRAGSQEAALERLAPLIEPLNISVRFLQPGDAIPPDLTHFEDYSGRIVRQTFREGLPTFRTLQLPRERIISAVIETTEGPLVIEFSRRRVSAAAPHQLAHGVVRAHVAQRAAGRGHCLRV